MHHSKFGEGGTHTLEMKVQEMLTVQQKSHQFPGADGGKADTYPSSHALPQGSPNKSRQYDSNALYSNTRRNSFPSAKTVHTEMDNTTSQSPPGRISPMGGQQFRGPLKQDSAIPRLGSPPASAVAILLCIGNAASLRHSRECKMPKLCLQV